jgi:hypothetical protein
MLQQKRHSSVLNQEETINLYTLNGNKFVQHHKSTTWHTDSFLLTTVDVQCRNGVESVQQHKQCHLAANNGATNGRNDDSRIAELASAYTVQRVVATPKYKNVSKVCGSDLSKHS